MSRYSTKVEAKTEACPKASFYGHLDIVRALLEDKRTDVNAQNLYGQTALYTAAANGHQKVIQG